MFAVNCIYCSFSVSSDSADSHTGRKHIGNRCLVPVETYKQADKHILFGVVDGPFSIAVLLVLLGHQRQVGVLNVVVIEATVQAGGGLVAVKAMFQVTGMAVVRTNNRKK